MSSRAEGAAIPLKLDHLFFTRLPCRFAPRNDNNTMNELVSTFHIDVKLLTAQVVNFAIVFVVLYYFAIRPLIKILNERSQKIEASLTNAEQIESELANAQEKREEIIKEAKQEANTVLEEVAKKADSRKQEMMTKAKEEIENIVSKTKEDLQVEKQIALKHIKEEAAEMITISIEKILSSKMNNSIDKDYIEKTVKDIKK